MPKSKVDKEEMIGLYLQGYEFNELAQMYGTKPTYIREILQRNHVPLRPKATVDEGKIKALFKAGWKLPMIAFDCEATIDQVKEVLGVK